MTSRRRLLVHSAEQIVQVVANNERVLTGSRQGHVTILQRTEQDAISIVVDSHGIIEAIGFDSEIRGRYGNEEFDVTVDARGKTIVPGLVDGHTHAIWAGDRVQEFAMKLAGATYMDVHRAGGGIHFTVRHVTEASEQQLYDTLVQHARRMLHAGTTLLECKTGYGLNLDAELKMLRVLERARKGRDVLQDISVTYCGAHAVPKDSTPEAATEDIVRVQLPKIATLMTSGELHVDNVDVFCEQGVFNVSQTRRILQAGLDIGLAVNFHGEELHCLHSAEMGAELKARAISHLEEVCDEGIRAMSEAGTVAVLLPTTAYVLRLRPPPARHMIDAGVAVALGSDFNPNAHCLAMPMVMHLACVLLGLSMPEALVAATINAAASLGKSVTHGSLEVGKVADMLVLDAPAWEHLIYQFGSYQHVISHVVKDGVVVHTKS